MKALALCLLLACSVDENGTRTDATPVTVADAGAEADVGLDVAVDKRPDVAPSCGSRCWRLVDGNQCMNACDQGAPNPPCCCDDGVCRDTSAPGACPHGCRLR